jgi:hypothetical protein
MTYLVQYGLNIVLLKELKPVNPKEEDNPKEGNPKEDNPKEDNPKEDNPKEEDVKPKM